MRRNDPNCRGHRHPKLQRPVSRERVEHELTELYRDAGFLGPVHLEWPRSLGETHDQNTRRYAQVAPYEDPPVFQVAPQAVYLPARQRRGLLAHEVGHVLDPDGTEDDADAAALRHTGVKIGYDHRWPGKGLQVARNPDESRRGAERRARASGAPADAAQALIEGMRAGQVSREEVEQLARENDEAALRALGLKAGDLQILDAARTGTGKIRKISKTSQARPVIHAYYEAIGFEPGGNWQGLRRGPHWIKWKARVYEVYKGQPGSWHKINSHSYVKAAQDLVAQAQQRYEGGGAVEQLEARRAKGEVKRKKAARKRELSKLALHAAVVELSLHMQPEARNDYVLEQGARDMFWREALKRSRSIQLPDDVTQEQIDAQLSVGHPPLPRLGIVREGRNEVRHAPERFEWNDPRLGMPITIRKSRSGPAIEVQIGNLFVDPSSGAMGKEGMLRSMTGEREQAHTGISGLVRVMSTQRSRFVVGILYMIMSSSPRRGTGTNMLRAWCRIMRAYGVSTWVARGVGDEGAAFLNELEARGEIRILNRLPNSDWVVECSGAFDDPRQLKLFNPRGW